MAYRRRMLKYRNKLFTFLDHDDVPWNNNNAEHAVKRFAKYRALVDGRYGEAGLHHYLVLLSIYVTCEFKRVDFLRFLLSREMDIDAYALTKPNGTPAPKVEVYAPGVQWRHPSRKQTWERQALRKQRQDSPKGANVIGSSGVFKTGQRATLRTSSDPASVECSIYFSADCGTPQDVAFLLLHRTPMTSQEAAQVARRGRRRRAAVVSTSTAMSRSARPARPRRGSARRASIPAAGLADLLPRCGV